MSAQPGLTEASYRGEIACSRGLWPRSWARYQSQARNPASYRPGLQSLQSPFHNP